MLETILFILLACKLKASNRETIGIVVMMQFCKQLIQEFEAQHRYMLVRVYEKVLKCPRAWLFCSFVILALQLTYSGGSSLL